MDLTTLLEMAVNRRASDLHLIAGLPPVLRVHGEILVSDAPPLAAEDMPGLVTYDLKPDQGETLAREQQLCYSRKEPGLGYFRVSVYYEQGTLGASIRVGMNEIRPLADLGVPAVTQDLARRPAGLILITGPTGSGKTTTLNALIDQINRERRCKIITVEDPIEYIHANKRSIIVQQEVHSDTPSFAAALVHILRQDPDVIAVGEMRDLETTATALTAAETGHLVISTLHTPDAVESINRIIDVFPPGQQNQVRIQLATSLAAVIAQQLLPRVDTEGRVLATEALVATPAVRNMIRDNKPQLIHGAIQTGRASGMHTMDASLRDLYQRGIITYDTAAARVAHPDSLRAPNAALTPVEAPGR